MVIAYDPNISKQTISRNSAHNFRAIKNSIPSRPPRSVLVGAWSLYNEAVDPSQSDQVPDNQHQTEHPSDQKKLPYLSAITSIEERLDDTRDSRKLQRSPNAPSDARPQLKASSSISLLERRPRQRQRVASRYQRAAENTELLDLTQRQLAEERKQLNCRLIKKEEKLAKRRRRFHDLQQKNRERVESDPVSTVSSNRITKSLKGRETRARHDLVNETLRNRPEQKRKVDELFARAGY